MRALKAMVIGMGVLIIVGVIVLIFAIVQKSGTGFGGKQTPVVSRVALPAGSEIVETRVGDKRIVLRLRLANGAGRLIILDSATGRLIGETALRFE